MMTSALFFAIVSFCFVGRLHAQESDVIQEGIPNNVV